jgi:hypothetical protein
VLVALEVGTPSPRPQQRLLDQVLGLLEGAEHAVAVHVDLAPVALGQLGEPRRGAHRDETAADRETHRRDR